MKTAFVVAIIFLILGIAANYAVWGNDWRCWITDKCRIIKE